jgi:polar amino acid transport system substrate-binding protein
MTLLTVFLLILTLQTQAKEKEYIVGVEAVSYYPLFDFSANKVNKPSFTRELLVKFFESHQLKYRFVALPIKRFDKWFIEQNIDFKFPDNIRWREDKKNKLNIVFSDPVIQLEAGTYVLLKNRDTYKGGVKSLVTITGFHPSLWLNEVETKQIVLQQVDSPISIVKHLLRGHADATNIDRNVINWQLEQLGESKQIVLAKKIPHQKFYYHFSSIKHPEIIKQFNIFLADNKKYIESLKKKYQIVE